MEQTAKPIPAAVIAVVLAALFTAAGTFQPFSPGDRQADQTSSYWIVVVAFLVAAALVFGLVVPRVRNLPRAALILGVVAVVSLPAFWLGLMPIFGVAAIALGWPARAAASGRGLAIGGLVLGALAVVASAVLAVSG